MMNIYEGNLEICILCRQGAVKGDRYYVRTDTNAVAPELLRKIPWYLAHLFDFLPTTHVLSAKQPDKFPFCCRICKKLLAKRENQVGNLSKVENCIRLRRGSSARRIAFTSTDVSCSTPAHPSDPFTCTISPSLPYHLYFFQQWWSSRHRSRASQRRWQNWISSTSRMWCESKT